LINSSNEQSYWRTTSGYEIDAVLGEAQVAIEIKSSRDVHGHHLNGLRVFTEEYSNARKIIVSCEPNPRLLKDIEIIPVMEFL